MDPTVDPKHFALRSLGVEGDRLCLGGVDAEELAARFGTPLFVHDAEVLRQRVAAVRAAFGDDVVVHYSIKANPLVAVAKTLGASGTSAEVASLGELEVARAARFDLSRVQFAGPGKTDAELEAAVRAGLFAINVEAPDELTRLADCAGHVGVRARVGLRVNPHEPLQSARLRMTGGGGKFGVDSARIEELAETVRGDDRLTLVGVHQYSGTQCFEASDWLEQAEGLLELCARLERSHGGQLAANVGGGFGVPCQAGDREFDLVAAGRGLRELLRGADPQRSVAIELGRYLAAPAGVYLSRVLSVKSSGDRRQVVLDGGIHHCAAAGGFGAVVRRPFAVVLADRLRAEPGTEPMSIGGPLCTPQDEWPLAEPFRDIARGDLIAVLNAGAYGLTYSPNGFLSHALPAEVLVDRGAARVARGRGLPTDALRGQVL